MDIYKELPESTKPEKAWMEDSVLKVDFHLWEKDMFYYVDAHYDIPVLDIVSYTMFYGPRKGFKKMEMYFRRTKDRQITLLKLSSNHEPLVLDIYNLLKPMNIKPRREILKTKEVRN